MHFLKKYFTYDVIALIPFYFIEIFRNTKFILQYHSIFKFLYILFYFKYEQFNQKKKILKEIITLEVKL